MKLKQIANTESILIFTTLTGLFLLLVSNSGLKWQNYSLWAPRLEAPDLVSLAEAEIGELWEAKFIVSNQGSQPLQLTNFRKGCACDVLGTREGETLLDLSTLNLKPGESAEIVFIQKVRGEIGKEMASLVAFETNDPSKPTYSISFRIPKITGGLLIVPEFIDLGILKEGQEIESVLELFEDQSTANEIAKIESTSPKAIKTRFVSINESPYRPIDRPGKRFLGRIFINTYGDTVGNIDYFIKVFVKSRSELPDKIAVHGTVSKNIAFYPETVVIPHRSELFSSFHFSCAARSSFKIPFTMKVNYCPPGFVVKVDSLTPSTVHTIKISVNDQKILSKIDFNKQQHINFSCLLNNEVLEFTLPIRFISD